MGEMIKGYDMFTYTYAQPATDKWPHWCHFCNILVFTPPDEFPLGWRQSLAHASVLAADAIADYCSAACFEKWLTAIRKPDTAFQERHRCRELLFDPAPVDTWVLLFHSIPMLPAIGMISYRTDTHAHIEPFYQLSHRSDFPDDVPFTQWSLPTLRSLDI